MNKESPPAPWRSTQNPAKPFPVSRKHSLSNYRPARPIETNTERDNEDDRPIKRLQHTKHFPPAITEPNSSRRRHTGQTGGVDSCFFTAPSAAVCVVPRPRTSFPDSVTLVLVSVTLLPVSLTLFVVSLTLFLLSLTLVLASLMLVLVYLTLVLVSQT